MAKLPHWSRKGAKGDVLQRNRGGCLVHADRQGRRGAWLWPGLLSTNHFLFICF